MKLRSRDRRPATVSADAVAAVIGTPVSELVARFGSVGDDWLGRPQLRTVDAELAHREWVEAVNRKDEVLAAFLRYQDDRPVRRRAVGDAAKAAVRESYALPHRGGQEVELFQEAQWRAERAALAEFDAAEPEMTITEFRERHG